MAILVIGGVLLRLWFLGNAPTNSDEATAGLVAHQIAHGHPYAFYWGQNYGGVETYILALGFRVFGQSPFVLNATPAVLSLIGSMLVWRIGLRLFPATGAAVAAVLSWIWSESTLWNSTKEYGFHEVGLVVGLIVLLQSVRVVQSVRRQGDDQVVDWAILGAAAGLGFWASPEIVYFALPAILIVFTTLRGRSANAVIRRIAVASATAIVGAHPWIWATLTSRNAGIPPSPVSYLSRLSTFFTHVLPMVFGLRVEGVGAWEGGRSFGVIVYALLLAFVVSAAVFLALRLPDARVLVLALALFPALYAAFPTSWFWNDGRYAVALTPVLSLIIAGGLWQMLRAPVATWVGCALLITAFASTLVAFNAGSGAIANPSKLAAFSANPNSAVTSLAGQLSRMKVSHAYAGYWVANDLTFISDDRVTALAFGENRNPPDAADTGKAPVAWVFVPARSLANDLPQLGSVTDLEPGSISETALAAWLMAHKVPYRVVATRGFDVILPSQHVNPAQIVG